MLLGVVGWLLFSALVLPSTEDKMANTTLGNASMRVHGGAQTGGISALATWADLQSLRDVRAAAYPGALADLGALASNAG